ncbi:MAG: hypothetical protein RLZZ86_24 [Cyanobacteriota bacterium]|jgi:hypothetical protein
MSVRLSVTGIVEIDILLKGLPNQVNHRVMGSAHADAAKPLINVAKNIVARREKVTGTGRLENSIGPVKLSQRKSKEVGLVHVGPVRKKGRYYGYHGHLVEYGHRLVSSKKTGKRNIGFVRPYPFMRPAFEQTKKQVETNITGSVERKLMSYMKRTIKNTGGTWIK